jgi:hypothetical protein
MTQPIHVFFAYAREDEVLRGQLEKHLATLRQQYSIREWHDRKIGAGDDWQSEISKSLEAADVIVILISAHFLASDYCNDVELKRALERHDAGTARVIPVLLRECDWRSAQFAKLQALPRSGKPVMSWRNRDKAWSDIAQGIREIIERYPPKSKASVADPATVAPAATPAAQPAVSAMSSQESLKAALTYVRDVLVGDGTLSGFEPVTWRHWQDAHERLGWRLFTTTKRDSFAFMGIYTRDDSLQSGHPDFYFFLEANRYSRTQKAMDAQGNRIMERIRRLGAEHPGITWEYVPGGWESIRARKSTADVPAASFQAEAIEFFRTSARSLRDCGILDEFLELSRAQSG